MTSRLVDQFHDILRRVGIDVIRFQPGTHALARRAALLRAYGVDLVVDVGANDGGYATEIRRFGYKGQIASFEPLPDAMSRLNVKRRGDPRWGAFNLALGDEAGDVEMHVAGNSASSSILQMLPAHERFAPNSANLGTILVPVRRLDDLSDDLLRDSHRPFLKIDTQGYEKRVLDGAHASMSRFVGIQLELSIVPLYEGAPLVVEMIARLESEGFSLMSVEPGFSEPVTGRLLQFDGVFFRPDPNLLHG